MFVSKPERGYFGQFPSHSGKRAAELVLRLGYRRTESRLSTLDEGLNPPGGWYCVGAYEKGALLCGLDDLYGFVEEPKKAFLAHLIQHYPGASMLFFELGSAANHFAYALYEGRERRRALAGDAERGVVVDDGALQPEEEHHFQRSTFRDGGRVFRMVRGSEMSEVQLPAYGENLVFAMTSRFLGQSLDRFSAEKLGVELAPKASANPFVALRRLFGRQGS